MSVRFLLLAFKCARDSAFGFAASLRTTVAVIRLATLVKPDNSAKLTANNSSIFNAMLETPRVAYNAPHHNTHQREQDFGSIDAIHLR